MNAQLEEREQELQQQEELRQQNEALKQAQVAFGDTKPIFPKNETL